METRTPRMFGVKDVNGTSIQVRRSLDGLSLDGLQVINVATDLEGRVHVFTGLAHWKPSQTHHYIFSGSVFWDMLYDVEPSKETAGRLQALLLQFQQLAHHIIS